MTGSTQFEPMFEYSKRNRVIDNDAIDFDGSYSYRNFGSINASMIADANKKHQKKQIKRGTVLFLFVLFLCFVWLESFSGTAESIRSSKEHNSPDTSLLVNLRSNEDDDATRSGSGDDKADEDWRHDLIFIEDVTNMKKDSDLPFFWHIPRTGGSTLKSIVGVCLRFTQASELGVSMGHHEDTELKVFEIDGAKYVNVDTTTINGIQRARDFGLASSGNIDIVFSSYLSETSVLFTNENMGRVFTFLRHPIDRAVSMFNYLASNRQLNPAIADMSLIEYAESAHIENNWMVRYLVNQMEGEITKDHLEEAKEVLRRKFFIGIVDEFEESIEQFAVYFDWWSKIEDTDKSEQREDCVSQLVSFGIGVGSRENLPLEKGDQAWALITWQNQYDTALYEYARDELFPQQSLKWGTKEKKKKLKKQKKALQKSIGL